VAREDSGQLGRTAWSGWEIYWSIGSMVRTEFQYLNYRRVPLSGTDRGKMTLAARGASRGERLR